MKITSIRWQKFEKLILKLGCQFKRQKGSHRIYSRADLKRPVVFSVHGNKRIPEHEILTNLKTLNLSKKEFLELIGSV